MLLQKPKPCLKTSVFRLNLYPKLCLSLQKQAFMPIPLDRLRILFYITFNNSILAP
jgi:hypothetical protein